MKKRLTRSINQFLEILPAGLFIWVFSTMMSFQFDNNCHAFNGRPLLFLVVLIWVDMIAQKINGFFPSSESNLALAGPVPPFLLP